jgi:hypothetical protein
MSTLLLDPVTLRPDKGFPPARNQVLANDDQRSGFAEWVPLLNGSSAGGVCSFNGQGLELISPDVSTGSPAGQIIGSSALRRLTRPTGFTHVYLRWEWYYRVFRSNSNYFTFTKGPEFGIDTADWGTYNAGGGAAGGLEPVAANRTLAMCRCAIYDEAGTYYGGKWQITHGSASAPSYVDLKDNSGNIIAPTISGYEPLQVGMNQGKWIRQITEQVFDLTGGGVSGATTAVLEGLRHNGIGFGSLSGGATGYTTPTTGRTSELLNASYVPAQSTDVNFQGGMNLYAQIDNRSNQPSKATLLVAKCRAVAF